MVTEDALNEVEKSHEDDDLVDPRKESSLWEFFGARTTFSRELSPFVYGLSFGIVTGAMGLVVGLILGAIFINANSVETEMVGIMAMSSLVDFMLGIGLVGFVVGFVVGLLRDFVRLSRDDSDYDD